MNKPKSRIENIVVQEMNNELLIYDLKDNKAFCLNETSAIIYQLCDGKRTIEEINNSVAQRLKQPVTDELIWLALDGLKKENLLEQSDLFEINFKGLHRRQIIKKIGFASMIMLPMVSSVIAPQAAQAASGLALNAACVSPSQCNSGNCFSNSTCCASSVFSEGLSPGITRINITTDDCPTLQQGDFCGTIGQTFCCSGSAFTSSCAPFSPPDLFRIVCQCN